MPAETSQVSVPTFVRLGAWAKLAAGMAAAAPTAVAAKAINSLRMSDSPRRHG
jgi:hypothetical protein